MKMSTPQAVFSSIDNAEIVQLILDGNPSGEELLYRQYARGLLFLARRHSPEHADDCMQDTVVAVIQQIKAGKLITPAALPGYLSTILKRTAWTANQELKKRAGDEETFDIVVKTYVDERDDPSRSLEVKEQARLMKDGLQRLKPIECEILTRFYLQEQTREEICEAMNLTETQFRLLKCRSKQVLTRSIMQATARRDSTESSNSAELVHQVNFV